MWASGGVWGLGPLRWKGARPWGGKLSLGVCSGREARFRTGLGSSVMRASASHVPIPTVVSGSERSDAQGLLRGES